jgi:hypothetical protein
LKDEAQNSLFKDSVRTALQTLFIAVIKTNQQTLRREKVVVCSEIKQYTEIQCGQNVQILNVKPVGASSN